MMIDHILNTIKILHKMTCGLVFVQSGGLIQVKIHVPKKGKHRTAGALPRLLHRAGRLIQMTNTAKKNRDFESWPLKTGWPLI